MVFERSAGNRAVLSYANSNALSTVAICGYMHFWD